MTKLILIAALLSCTKSLNGNFRNKMNGNKYVDLSDLSKVLRKNSTPLPLDITKASNSQIEEMLRSIFYDYNIISEGTSEEIKKIINLISKALNENNKKEIDILKEIFVNTTSGKCKQNILMVASSFCSLYFVELLISLGMDVNYSDESNITPLMCAAGRTDIEVAKIVKTLLEAGACKEVVSKDGNRALDIAKEQNNQEIIYLLSPKASIKSRINSIFFKQKK